MKPFFHKLWRSLRNYFPEWLDRGRQARRLLETAARLAASEPASTLLQAQIEQGVKLITLVTPVYNTNPAYLDDLLESFRSQRLPGGDISLFELVLSDDGSTRTETKAWLAVHIGEPGLRIILNPTNRGIAAATNAGIIEASGEWIALIDHDDAIAPFALERIARAVLEKPAGLFFYTDEVITDGTLDPVGYFLKPAWDEVLLSGVNFINHFSIYRRDRLVEIGMLREGFQGSQDYDLLLRYTNGLATHEILHVPYPAYLWRRDGQSYSAQFIEDSTKNARAALAENYSRPGKPMSILPALDPNLHRLDLAGPRQEWPLVSVIIPSRNAKMLIQQVMHGLIHKTDYPALDIIVVDNGSDDPDVLALYRQYEVGPIPFRASIQKEAFNFSRAINRGVALARGDILLLLNNDIEILEPGWLQEMVSCLDFKETGIVGAKLLYPDRTIQHVGVIAGLGGLAGHWFINQKRDCPGPMSRLNVRQSLSVVTGACLLLTRTCWNVVGAFDEENFAIAYNDVDYCLRAVHRGFRVVWTPFAELIHHESASRGSDETSENIERFHREQNNLRARHRTDILVDPAFNPWWTRGHSIPADSTLKKLPPPRYRSGDQFEGHDQTR